MVHHVGKRYAKAAARGALKDAARDAATGSIVVMNTAKKIAFCSVLTAVSSVVLFIGGFIEIIDLTAAAIASLCVILGVIEFGYRYSFLIYSVSAVLSFLVLPGAARTPALYFAVFFGYYPILKSVAEKAGIFLSWAIKILIFSAAYTVLSLLTAKIIFPQSDFGLPQPETKWLLAVFYFICLIVFILYDIALTRAITIYISRLRRAMGIDKLLK